MSIYVNSCTDNETKSLEYNSCCQEVEILNTTIGFLNEQIESNHNNMKKIRTKLNKMKIAYTYNQDESLIVESNELDSNMKEKVLKLKDSYNEFHNKNQVILNNIIELEKNFLKQFKNDLSEQNMNEIEQTGLIILKAQEEERSRIAADLHDSIIQNLTNLLHKVELCGRLIDKDPIGVKLDLQLMMQSTKVIIDDIRGIIYNLRPMAFDDLGIDIAIERFLEQFEKINQIHIQFINQCTNINTLNSTISLTLFRVIQEACCNAVKHGQASKVEVTLSNNETCVELQNHDNGIGFDTVSQRKAIKNDNTGFGLSIMKERIYLLSGTILIQSQKDMGTTISISIPLINC